MRRGIYLALLLLLFGGALLFRLPDLGNRPMHGDEAVHAVKFEELWKQGTYRYDPNEYHGPTIYYAALPSVLLRGRHELADVREADLRLPIALFGAALVLLLALLDDALGRPAALSAALLAAVSPAFVFYSRYFIQETLLVCFTLALLACGWRWVRDRRPVWALLAGLSAGLMIASKETAVLSLGAILVAWLGCRGLSHRERSLTQSEAPAEARPGAVTGNARAAGWFLAGAMGAAAWFLSGFGSNPMGPLLYLKAFTPWLHRAGGTEVHRHPWSYYLELLLWHHEKGSSLWTETLLAALAVAGLVVALFLPARAPRGSSPVFARFLAIFTVTLTVAYSVIPYKTPWCVLSFLLGIILLAGYGVAVLGAALPRRWGIPLAALLLAAAGAQSAFQAYRASFTAYADPGNPWAYAQPVPDVEKLAGRVDTLTSAGKDGRQTVIEVFSVDTYYWPLPWYLRRYPNVGYWTEVPKDADAPLILASPEFDEELTRRLNDTHLMTGFFKMRQDTFFQVWVRMDLWKAYLDWKRKNAPAQ